MKPDPRHQASGRECTASGAIVYCRCGLTFHEHYPVGVGGFVETDATRMEAMDAAEDRWLNHAKERGAIDPHTVIGRSVA